MNNELKELLQSVIQAELKPMNDRLDRFETIQQDIKSDIELIKQDVHEIKEDQHLIKKAVLDTNERVMKMEAVLENQHRIIELLSARSIEQEAHIKLIK